MEMTTEQKSRIAAVLREFLEHELDVSIGSFEADDLTDFVVEKVGPWFYNQGVLDSRARLAHLMDGIQDELSLLEKASPLDR